MTKSKILYVDSRFGYKVTQENLKDEIMNWATTPDFDDFLLLQDLDDLFDMTPVFDTLEKKLKVRPTMDYCNLINPNHISRELIAQVFLKELQPQMDQMSSQFD